MFPISLEVRKLAMLPIIEVKAKAQPDFKVELWINYPLTIIEIGTFMGGRLMHEEPQEKLEANTLFFKIIFQNEKTATDFMNLLKNG